jgi:lysozyme
MMLDGIDVSKAQGIIDWNKLGQSNKISFAACKATEGIGYLDSQFKNNWKGIKDQNLLRGAYHFAYTVNDPIKEAEWFINQFNEFDITDFLALDIEANGNAIGQSFVDWVLTWLQTVIDKTHIVPFIYTGGPYFNQHAGKPEMQYSAKLASHPLWLAAYVPTGSLYKYVPEIWKTAGIAIWQKSGDVCAPGDNLFYVPGIKTIVDHNVFDGDLIKLKELVQNMHTISL